MRVDAENGATAGKFDLAKRAKAANLDAIHDTVHEMARDEARHGKAFEGLLKEILWLSYKPSKDKNKDAGKGCTYIQFPASLFLGLLGDSPTATTRFSRWSWLGVALLYTATALQRRRVFRVGAGSA